eukprot:m.143678 g.143678  ORF g.143678 m.143678 type:complete len:501 (+) comp14993_c0_seq5:159-1661(+)
MFSVAARPWVASARSGIRLASAIPARRQDLKKITEEDISAFRAILGERVLTNPDDIAPYNEDWMRKYKGRCGLVARPKTTEEVSALLRYCFEHRIAVTPQGGNTGLVGGSVPVHDEVVISTSLMDKVISLDVLSGVLVCQAGCVLQRLDEEVGRAGFAFPLDLGAKGSCQIGGNISTNAGGLRLLRYGSLHGSVLGLEIVQSDGTVLDCLNSLRKDNTGYHLAKLFIGAEGTLGFITKAAISLPPKPKAVNVAFMACQSYPQVLEVFRSARENLGEVLSACEFLDDAAMSVTVAEPSLRVRNPLSLAAPFYVLIETRGADDSHDKEKMNRFLTTCMEKNVISDGTMAQDSAQVQSLWDIREKITEALKLKGFVYKYDLSMPQPDMYRLVEEMRVRVRGIATSCVGYGHLGDGNLHLNITSDGRNEKLFSLIEPYVYQFTAGVRGSISAEHGLGAMKANDIHYSKSPAAIAAMQRIKTLFDPRFIMNPYKTLPSQAHPALA